MLFSLKVNECTSVQNVDDSKQLNLVDSVYAVCNEAVGVIYQNDGSKTVASCMNQQQDKN